MTDVIGRRITVVSQLPPPVHGVTVVTRALIDVLENAGAEVAIVDRRFSRTVAEIGDFQLRKLIAVFGYWFRFLAHIVRRRPDAVVLFGTTRTFSFLADLGVVLLARLFRLRLVNYVHSVGYRSLAQRRLYRRLVPVFLRSADLTVCLGPTLVADVDRWARPGTIRTVANAAPRRIAPARHREPNLLFMSNLIPEKGVDDFLDVAIALCESRSELTCVLAGAIVDSTAHARNLQRVADAGLTSRIEFVGVAGEQQKQDLLNGATALVFPSRYALEAQPLTIIEAMSAGLPVVAFDTGGVRDIVIDRVTGFLVDTGDGAELLERTRELLDDTGLRASLSSGASLRYELHHSMPTFQQNWTETLTALIEEKNR